MTKRIASASKLIGRRISFNNWTGDPDRYASYVPGVSFINIYTVPGGYKTVARERYWHCVGGYSQYRFGQDIPKDMLERHEPMLLNHYRVRYYWVDDLSKHTRRPASFNYVEDFLKTIAFSDNKLEYGDPTPEALKFLNWRPSEISRGCQEKLARRPEFWRLPLLKKRQCIIQYGTLNLHPDPMKLHSNRNYNDIYFGCFATSMKLSLDGKVTKDGSWYTEYDYEPDCPIKPFKHVERITYDQNGKIVKASFFHEDTKDDITKDVLSMVSDLNDIEHLTFVTSIL